MINPAVIFQRRAVTITPSSNSNCCAACSQPAGAGKVQLLILPIGVSKCGPKGKQPRRETHMKPGLSGTSMQLSL